MLHFIEAEGMRGHELAVHACVRRSMPRCGRVLQDVVRQEYWAHASVMLNAPGHQQALRQSPVKGCCERMSRSHLMQARLHGDRRAQQHVLLQGPAPHPSPTEQGGVGP
jgi:hypothetical protein